jgi:hypothetical protein
VSGCHDPQRGIIDSTFTFMMGTEGAEAGRDVGRWFAAVGGAVSFPLDTAQMRRRDAVARRPSDRHSAVADQEIAAGKEGSCRC